MSVMYCEKQHEHYDTDWVFCCSNCDCELNEEDKEL